MQNEKENLIEITQNDRLHWWDVRLPDRAVMQKLSIGSWKEEKKTGVFDLCYFSWYIILYTSAQMAELCFWPYFFIPK